MVIVNNKACDKLKFLFVAFLCFISIVPAVRAQHTLPLHQAYSWSNLSIVDFKGEIIIPVVFVDFSQSNGDNEMTISDQSKDTWMEHLNESNTLNHMGSKGSVSDYFYAQSYGQLTVTFEEIGTYTAAGKAAGYADYTADAKLVYNAVTSLMDVDWQRYDCNGDKEIDCVLFIFAGHADGDLSSRKATITSIYPHQNWLTNRQQPKAEVGDGYKVQSYVFTNNLRDSSSSVDAINAVCHELGHGIFDLCDYYKNLTSCMGQYDAMCYGFRQTSYGSANNHCCDYTTFNRMYLGWLKPCELSLPGHVKLHPLSRVAEACVVFDPNNQNHFFLLENRATLSNTWDAHLPAGGLILTEIYYSRQQFESHNVNATASRRNVAVICAATGKPLGISNSTYYQFDQKQVPFGISGRKDIGSGVSSVFASQPITNITINADQSIEFDFMGGGENVDLSVEQHQLTALSSHQAYDLLGRQVSEPLHPGIYIVDGRKYLVK